MQLAHDMKKCKIIFPMSNLKIWWQATRPFAYSVSAIPPILGTIIAVNENPGLKINWIYFFLVLLGCVSAHAGSNLFSDYFDFKNKVDRKETHGGSRVLPENLMTPKQVLAEAIVVFALASAIGLYFIFKLPNGLSLLWVILVGAFLNFFYTYGPAIKYKALGDFAVFIAFGPAMALGVYMVHAGHFSYTPILYALPIALLVDAVLHSNNLRDIENDRVVNIKTIAMVIGEQSAKKMYYALLVGSYVATVLLCIFFDLTWLSLLTFLSLPLCVRLIKKVRAKNKTPEKEFASIDAETAQFHLAFSLLFCTALFIKHFIK